MGPLRLQEVFEVAECGWDTIPSLLRGGLIVKYGQSKKCMLTLNPAFPAAIRESKHGISYPPARLAIFLERFRSGK